MFIIGLLGFAAASALGGIAAERRAAVRRPGPAGRVRRAARPRRAVADHRHLHRAPRSGRRRSASSARSPAAARPSACRSAASSPSTRPGAGACWSTCPIALITRGLPRHPVRARSRAHGDTKYDVPGADLRDRSASSRSSTASPRRRRTAGTARPTLAVHRVWAIVLLVSSCSSRRARRNPLLPLRILENRNRGGAYLALFLVGVGLFAMFLFLTYFFQGVLGYTPLQSGLRSCRSRAGVIVSAGLASQLLPRFGPRLLVTGAGFLLAVIGMLLLTRMTPTAPTSATCCRPHAHQPGHGPDLRPAVGRVAVRDRQRTTPVSPRPCSTPPSRSAARSASPS